ncbi:BCCT family transporter [Telluribacter sp. SYSU D00476]|uniref:BCCT family transporter n=1 Tax=Telluribacter sp. SYSU D00476 TaxID=2811430 RepID=UPI001FF67C14|nr:BCCT family transporter [Telluribacter sp. SYSU D00476]
MQRSSHQSFVSTLRTSPPILVGILLGGLILLSGLVFPEGLSQVLSQTNAALLAWFGRYYLVVGLLVVAVSVGCLFLPFAKERLGSGPPDYSLFSWIALLYSTGMGSGLLLRAVQEPVYYYQHPPVSLVERKQVALQYTFFHWGLTPWAMYSLFGLIVAYRLHRRDSTTFLHAACPFDGQKSAALSNLFMTLITLIGVVASLALGASQFTGGLQAFLPVAGGRTFLLLAATGIGLVATASALTGLKRVIRYLADFDLAASLLLLAYIASFLDWTRFFPDVAGAMGSYLVHFVDMSLSTGSYRTDVSFRNDWTVFYWAFWLAWVPFTGIFMARISRGRSISQFLIATLIVPSAGTLLWFSIFAHQAFSLISQNGAYGGEFDNVFTSLFRFLEYFPLSSLTVAMAMGLVLIAVINSVDSAIFVLGMFSQDGNPNPAAAHKLWWGGIITITAVGLVAVGSQQVIQAVSNLLIIMALPFSGIYLYLIWKFVSMIRRQKRSKNIT